MTIDQLAAELDHDLVYLVPSRGRPHNAAALIDAWAATSAGAAALVIAVDIDDPELGGYLELAEHPGARFDWLRWHVGDRLRLGGTLNALAPTLAVGRAGVGFMGDDHRPKTSGWDAKILAELHATPGAVVYGNDLVQGAALPTAVALSSAIILELGYYVPPGAVHLYLDNYWRELGRRLNTLRYLPATIIEHQHPLAGTAPTDAGYAEVNAPALYAADEAVWRRYVAEDLDDAVAAIHASLNRPEEVTP